MNMLEVTSVIFLALFIFIIFWHLHAKVVRLLHVVEMLNARVGNALDQYWGDYDLKMAMDKKKARNARIDSLGTLSLGLSERLDVLKALSSPTDKETEELAVLRAAHSQAELELLELQKERWEEEDHS